jgi:hypothetical protein
VLRDGWGPYPRRSLDLMDGGGNGRSQPEPQNTAFDEITAERETIKPR